VKVDRVPVRRPRQRPAVPGDEVRQLAQPVDGIGQPIVEDQRAGRAEVQELGEERRAEAVQSGKRLPSGRGPVLIVVAAEQAGVASDGIR